MKGKFNFQNLLIMWKQIGKMNKNQIEISVKDFKAGLKSVFKIEASEHLKNRLIERKIDDFLLILLLVLGDKTCGNNANFYTIKSKKLLLDIDKKVCDKLNKLVLVTDHDEKEVLTIYRNSSPLHYVKKKCAA